jgi:hypothetical protein
MTARMVPVLDPNDIEDHGERLVYVALREQLPDDWVVIYHYTYCIKLGWRLYDGEADFIVVAPGRGLLFLEVKQSYGFECVAGQWYRVKKDGSREESDNPFDQATRNKHNIVRNIICHRLSIPVERFPGTYGHAVMYPRAKVHGRLCASQAPQVLINYFDMVRLHERLEQAFADWGSASRGAAFTPNQCERVITVLEGNTQLVTVAAAEAEDDDAKIEALTSEQYDTFRDVLSRNRVRVLGKAGSGKTMLAVWTAQALASVGDSVLYLCFNRLLARWVTERYELPEGVKARRYHSLCREYAKKAGIPFEPPEGDAEDTETFWAEQSPSILVETIDVLGDGCRFDSIIVDEAQDFHKDWWISIQLLLKNMEKGHFYLFYDPDQSGLYGHGQAYPAEVSHVRTLSVNCRNTKQIARYCGEVIGSPIQSFQRAPEGVSPVLLSPVLQPAQRAMVVKDVLRRWLQEGFRPSQIAILSPWRRGNQSSVLTHLTSVANHPILGEDDELLGWMAGDHIWGSTIKAFKGLEADCIILTDLPTVSTTGFSRSELYVAASRAKLHLFLVPSSDTAYVELESWLIDTGSLERSPQGIAGSGPIRP